VTKVAAIVTEVDRSQVQVVVVVVVVVVVEADLQVAAEGVEADLLARAEEVVVAAAAEEEEEEVAGEEVVAVEEEEVVVVEAAEGAEVEVVHPQTVTKRKHNCRLVNGCTVQTKNCKRITKLCSCTRSS
jgi:hypothetical protein